MQAVLITLGILGFGAVLISVYVFIVAARRYVHERVEHPHPLAFNPQGVEKLFITRSGRDRRRASSGKFPMTLSSGETIVADRRRLERRHALV
jgi:hypothetical protein